MGDPLNVTCGVCQDVCKRAVRVKCCKERACRNCAVKYISKHRTCWDSDCTITLSTNDVVNDEELREFIESLEDPGPINCTICGEICKRGAVSSCCKAPCCRSCGVKKVTADRKCWMEDCGEDGLECDDLENDDVLRDAVVHYMNTGILNPDHLRILLGRREKNEEEDGRSTNSALGKKRKSVEEEFAEVKKAKLSPNPSVVYLELNMIHSPNKSPQMLQIGLWSQYSVQGKIGNVKPGKLSLFQSIACPALKSIKSGSILNAVGLHKEGEKLYFTGKSGQELKELECKSEKQSLWETLDFLKDVKSKSGGGPLILATYRNVTIVHFIQAWKRHVNIKNLENIVGGVVSLEDVLEQNDIVDWLPMKSMKDICINFVNNKFATETMRGCSPNILAQAFTNMAEKYNLDLSDHTKLVQQILDSSLAKLDLSIPLEENTYVIENSSNFDTMEPMVDVEEKKKVNTEVHTTQHNVDVKEKKKLNKAIDTNKPITDVEEKKKVDHIVEVSYRSLCFPIHSQPILAELKNVDENVKFVKLKLSTKLPNTLIVKNKTNPFKVYRHEGKSYIIPSIYPTQELPYKVNSQVVQHLEDLKARSVLGEYTKHEGTDPPLLTNKPIKLIATKTGENENIFIGPEPTVIVVTLTNLPTNAEVTPEHAFVMGSCVHPKVEILSRLFGIRHVSKSSPRARIVVRAKESVGKWVIKNGVQIGTAALISDWTISRVVEEAQAFGDLCRTIEDDGREWLGDQDYPMIDEGVGHEEEDMGYHEPNFDEHKAKINDPVVDTIDTETNTCSTVASTRLYAQGSNPVLVKLRVSGSPKFNVIRMEYSGAFKKLVQAEEGGRFSGKFKAKVLWVNESKVGKKGGKSSITVPVPYAFMDIRLGKKKANQYVDHLDLAENFELATYAPVTHVDEEEVDLSMNVCVDFNAKNVILDQEPKLVEVYLKFRETEIDKKKAMEQIFYIQECINPRIEILSLVFKPQKGMRLAPQKTSTNDMKAGLIMKATHPGDVIPLMGRQVIAVAKVASSNEDLSRHCAVSGSGFVRAQPETTFHEEFGDLSCKEPGCQDSYGGSYNEPECRDSYGGAYNESGYQDSYGGSYQHKTNLFTRRSEVDYVGSRQSYFEEEYPSDGRHYGQEEYSNKMYGDAIDTGSDFTAVGFQSRFSSTGNGSNGMFQPVGFQSSFSNNGSQVFDNGNGVSRDPGKKIALGSLATGNKAKAQNEVPFVVETCPICPATLQSKLAVTAHYVGKPHEKKVRLYLANLWNQPLPSQIINMTSFSKCDLCKADLTSLKIAMAHYEGNPHAKKVTAYCVWKGVDVPQRKKFNQGKVDGDDDKVKKQFNRRGKAKSKFQCKLCDVMVGDQSTLDEHFKGSKHQKNVNSRVKSKS